MQHMLGGQAEQLRAQDAYGAEPGGPGGGPLDQQEENKLRAIESMLPHMEGMEPSMIETILELSQGGGPRAGETFTTPGGATGMYTSKGGRSATLISGAPKAQTPLEDARTTYYKEQARKAASTTESNELYLEMLKGMQGDVDTGDMDTTTKKKVTDLEDEIKLAQDNLKKITQLGNATPFVNYDSGVIDLRKSRKAQEAGWWRNVKSKSDAKLEEEQKLESLQKQLNKLRGDSGGAAVPAPPLYDVSPENLFE
jgi:hypothetical protein